MDFASRQAILKAVSGLYDQAAQLTVTPSTQEVCDALISAGDELLALILQDDGDTVSEPSPVPTPPPVPNPAPTPPQQPPTTARRLGKRP